MYAVRCALSSNALQIPMAQCTGVWHPRSTPFVHTTHRAKTKKRCIHAKWKAFGCLIATELNQIIQLCFCRSLCYSVAHRFVRARLLFTQLCKKGKEEKWITFGASRKNSTTKIELRWLRRSSQEELPFNGTANTTNFPKRKSKQQINT